MKKGGVNMLTLYLHKYAKFRAHAVSVKVFEKSRLSAYAPFNYLKLSAHSKIERRFYSVANTKLFISDELSESVDTQGFVVIFCRISTKFTFPANCNRRNMICLASDCRCVIFWFTKKLFRTSLHSITNANMRI